MRLNYLTNNFWVVIIGLLFSFQSEVLFSQESLSPIIIIQSSEDEFSLEVTNEIVAAFGYTEFPYKILDLSNSNILSINTQTKLVINTTTDLTTISDNEIDKLVGFLGRGGNMIFFGTVTDERFAYLQGIKAGADYSIERNVRGITGKENIFPGYQGLEFYSFLNVPHDRLMKSNFIDQIRVLSNAVSDREYPILFENKIGLGTTLVFNSYILYEKDFRGLMFSTILKMLPHVPYRNASIGTIFLDDFPAPLYNTKIEPVATEYNAEQAEFVANIWWPDMKKLADSLLITYSAMTAFNYNANITPPFDFNEWTSATIEVDKKKVYGSIYLAQDIKKTSHELAFHGYNHFSLITEEWNANKDFMATALSSVKKRWRIDRLGSLPTTYVPPTNYIDSLGIQALTTVMPSIKVLSSLYLGDKEDGGGREFTSDPYSDKLFDYPRISSGFTMKGNSIFDQHGMQLLTGIWNHFIHPDDIFQIVQRDADNFESRNPDNLGWKTTPNKPSSLYKEFVKRLLYTKKQYPFIRLVSAEYGAKIAEDWANTDSDYLEDPNNYIVKVISPTEFKNQGKSKNTKYWFVYVPQEEKNKMEAHIRTIADGYAFAKYWDGYLFQFYSESNQISIPKPNSLFAPEEEIKASLALVKSRFENYLTNPFYQALAIQEEEISLEVKLANAIDSYLKNPDSFKIQEDLISLSIENDQAYGAIQVLEYRLENDSTWREKDIERLVTYYGYESAYEQSEIFLEKLWRLYRDEKVIQLKDSVVENLGLYSQEFVSRWALRELELYGSNIFRTLAYTKTIENNENWPDIKRRLKDLIRENPKNDSLYAYTLQRSFYYESSDSTIALLEEFPEWAHNQQLSKFATQFANIYGYEVLDYNKALYWAEISNNISNRTKLEWIAQNNEMDRFYETSKKLLEDTNDDSLRAYAGTTLYYRGFIERGREIMYPLFEVGKNGDTQAHKLIEEEFRFINYKDKRELYSKYPNFFSEEERQKIETDYRWNEGIRGSLFGEYFTDNFDNNSARGGISVQIGNRRNRTNLFKLEDIYINNSIGGQNFFSNFTGIGYKYEKRKEDFSRVFRFGPSLYAGSEGILAEAFVSYSISYDSTFTSLNLSFEPEFTQQSILQDIYKLKGEFYREDPWLKNKLLTTLSGNTQIYTNSVVDYSLTSRGYFQPSAKPFRGRLIGELGWQDASKKFVNADPFFTQDNYFLQGLGFDLRYRDPNTFDYNSLVELELMGKHAITDGFFITGRANIEHKFKKFWQVKVGTEFSTSSVYRSNRIFFTVSHFFNRTVRNSKQR